MRLGSFLSEDPFFQYANSESEQDSTEGEGGGSSPVIDLTSGEPKVKCNTVLKVNIIANIFVYCTLHDWLCLLQNVKSVGHHVDPSDAGVHFHFFFYRAREPASLRRLALFTAAPLKVPMMPKKVCETFFR